MILRRLSTSIHRQDWFTVLVEIVIVVVGVFLGIRASNWNAASLLKFSMHSDDIYSLETDIEEIQLSRSIKSPLGRVAAAYYWVFGTAARDTQRATNETIGVLQQIEEQLDEQ